MNIRGKYIAIEGLKGAGKSTQIKKLCEILADNHIVYSVISPTAITNKNSIVEILYSKYKWLQNKSFSRALLYSYRAIAAQKKANWNAHLILGDRSIVTSYITRWRKWINSPLLTIIFVNILQPFIKSPDIIIYIEVPIETLEGRLRKRGVSDIDSTTNRLQEMDLAYKEIVNTYKIRKLRNTKWISIKGDTTEENVSKELYNIIIENIIIP